MMMNGKKMTITWHVNKLNISHIDEKEVTKIIKWMKVIYGNHMRE